MDRQKKNLVRGPAEAHWKRTVSTLHAAFCECGNYLAHFNKRPRWSTVDPRGGDGGDTTTEDAELVSLLEDVETTEFAIDAALEEAG